MFQSLSDPSRETVAILSPRGLKARLVIAFFFDHKTAKRMMNVKTGSFSLC